jgi:molybdate/tungstate transport system substrate-binding protein
MTRLWPVTLVLCVLGCGGEADVQPLRIFHAAGLTPVLDAVREDCRGDLGIELMTEGSGSQVACRKVSELGRDCDLVMVADPALIAELLPGYCSWRLDFASDEVVLGVGLRAPNADLAEKDWPAALLAPHVRLGRVDENQGPIGYRALLVWRLQEMQGMPGLCERLLARTAMVVDDVGHLTPLLRNGDLDYGFVYRSICIAQDVRYISLDPTINLGSPDVDYSAATVTYRKLKAGAPEDVVAQGAPVTWALSIPDRGANDALARRFIDYLLRRKADVLDVNGFRPIRPACFYGPRDRIGDLRGVATYTGDLQ